ncbi:MAG: ferritin-like domain-containing protein [Sphingobacteriales bacterium]|nr:MAG: ferritin-like domain-containing protein [Sphingobacteriales bacterium]
MNPTLNAGTLPAADAKAVSRRRFLGYAGALAGASVLATSCNKDDDSGGGGVNLGGGDTGILNYAYALEQLEAAFYTQVVDAGMSWASASEKQLLADIRDHEIAHREFFRAAIGSNRIQDLTPNFSTINFTSRDSVLQTAQAFEDLGVQAYNGAGQLLMSADYLALAGKIVSVEARHAAYIRELLKPVSFADTSILDPTNRIDQHKMPPAVLSIAGKYITERLDASKLPTL